LELVNTVRDYWVDHRWTDLCIAGAAVALHSVVVWRTGRFDLLAWVEASDRRGAYSAFAVVVSLTGALSGVAVSQLGSAKGMRATALKKHGGKELARSWRSIYVGSMCAALLALVALVLDATKPPAAGHNAAVAQWIFEFAVAYAVLKFARLTVLFEPMITAFVKDDADPDEAPLAPAPRIDVTALEARRRATAG
jgi:hypothetical protein